MDSRSSPPSAGGSILSLIPTGLRKGLQEIEPVPWLSILTLPSSTPAEGTTGVRAGSPPRLSIHPLPSSGAPDAPQGIAPGPIPVAATLSVRPALVSLRLRRRLSLSSFVQDFSRSFRSLRLLVLALLGLSRS